jgi:acetyltransferase
MAANALTEILAPNSIAVIGASKDPTKRGFRAIEKLLADGYLGAIYPINPKAVEILGLHCYASIDDVPAPVDLALICTPATTVPGLIEKCGAKGVKGAVVLAGGFAEAGSDGERIQAAMVHAGSAGQVRIIGPNTSGIFNTHKSCNIVGFSNLKKGGVGLLSQSGNLALSLVTEAQANGYIGLSTYIGIGNEADIRVDEYLDYFLADADTQVVIVYIEGVKHGRKFLESLRRISRSKPVVVYKSGRTSAGISSAKSHTGALAGDFAVSEGVLRQAGAVLVRRSDEILPVAEALSLMPRRKMRNIAVLADGGGHATIAADALTEQGLVLATLADKTRHRLAVALSPSASLANPVDIAGAADANPGCFAECVEILLDDEQVDGLLISGLFGGYGVRFSDTLTPKELVAADRIVELSHKSGKPVIVHTLYGALHGDARPVALDRLRKAGIPVHASSELAVSCLRALGEFAETLGEELLHDAVPVKRPAAIEKLFSHCLDEGRTFLLEHEGRKALEAAGIRMMPARLVRTEEEAAQALLNLLPSPVAMKVVSRDILHKTDAGGIKLNVENTSGVMSAFGEILANARRAVPTADITGVLVTPMAPSGGSEVIIGVVRDPSYGHVMMVGSGGIMVEVIRDVAFRSLPITEADAWEMLDSLKSKALFEGFRSQPPVDRALLVDLMRRISDLFVAFPEIEELDLNPVRAYADDLLILDVRMLLRAPQPM